jgi:hypothetical protein
MFCQSPQQLFGMGFPQINKLDNADFKARARVWQQLQGAVYD